jgi:hypothetical protein
VHTNLNTEALAAAASKQLKSINYLEIDQPPWRQPRPIKLVIGWMAKLEAKRAVSDFLSSTIAERDLVIYTDGSAHPKEDLGAEAVTADGVFSKLCFLGPPGTASNFECELVGIQLDLELGKLILQSRPLNRIVLLTENQAAIE